MVLPRRSGTWNKSGTLVSRPHPATRRSETFEDPGGEEIEYSRRLDPRRLQDPLPPAPPGSPPIESLEDDELVDDQLEMEFAGAGAAPFEATRVDGRAGTVIEDRAALTCGVGPV